jgi:hypothetical protein
MTRPIETVAVVGRDAPLWLAAIALHRAVGKSGVKVQVVELPSLLSPVDVYAALPSIRGLHGLLGLDEAMVLAASDGVPVVGQRFSNWSGAAPPFVHGYDDAPPPGGDVPQGYGRLLPASGLGSHRRTRSRLPDAPASAQGAPAPGRHCRHGRQGRYGRHRHGRHEGHGRHHHRPQAKADRLGDPRCRPPRWTGPWLRPGVTP